MKTTRTILTLLLYITILTAEAKIKTNLPLSILDSQLTSSSIREKKISMPTYPFSDPNPIARPQDLYYPYFRFDGYSHKAVDQEWKVVEMENEYIKLTVFPEIGGKIWGAIEKSTGREFIYYNHSVKFRDIAMRGAWTSGGIEFNFGIIGHVPTSATPVDYLTRTNEDGSVSCFISSIELLTRTTWTVEINLPKDKAYFTTHTTWSNTSQLDQPYYQWMNAAYKADGNLQFCYPGQHYIGHGGDAHAFPVDEQGRDISWYEKNNFGADKSYHVLGKYNDYYGAYWHDDDFGSAHYAPYDEKLGMKIYLWGLSREGGIWEQLLTDIDGQYVELQSGRMFNQPATSSAYTPYKHFSFIPGTTDKWTEYWFPVKGTGGISKANSVGSINVTRHTDKVEIIFSPLQSVNTTLTLYAGNKKLHQEQLQLKVLETWKKTIPLSPATGPITVEIGDKELVWNESPESDNLKRPTNLPADFDWEDTYGLYVTGEQLMNQKIYARAESFFRECLLKNPHYLPVLNKLASLCYRTGRYEEALTHTRTALSLDTYDGEANYLYGLVNFRLDNQADAKDGFSIASYSPAYRSSAYAGLSQCFLKEKDWKKVIHYASLSLESNQLNQDAIRALLVAYRYTGQKEAANELTGEILVNSPLNHPVRFEETLRSATGGLGQQQSSVPSQTDGIEGLQTDDLSDFTSLIRNELPDETYMEIAGWYVSVGLTGEALTLLSLAQNNPIALYQSAFLKQQAGEAEDSRRLLEKANSLSPELIFPFRHEHLQVLEWAMAESTSWQSKYYTAILYWHLGNKEKALDLLNKCDDSSFAPLFLSRATLKNGKEKLNDLLKSEKMENSWRTGIALMNFYIELGEVVPAMQTGKRYTAKYPGNYMLGLKYAKTLNLNGKYDESIALLRKTQVLPNEGAYEGRAIYKEANLCQAINFINKRKYKNAINSVENSKEWIENLGVGKPYEENIDTRLEDFILATIYEKMNEDEKSNTLYRKITEKEWRTFTSNSLLTALSLRKSGRTQEADRMAQSWLKENPDNKIAQWCTAIYNGDETKASGLLSERDTNRETTPWEAVSHDYNFTIISSLFQSLK